MLTGVQPNVGAALIATFLPGVSALVAFFFVTRAR